ncbi:MULTISPECIES: hypothetical protein [unclassified Mycobacterium]|uniref:hypothetical protein n=1 Tax=unclassified Mycobacterium TaxID=2642494 RepID=UPI0029C8D6CA|nr:MULTISPECIES: hypothetical protein [unclassified Mycobacterium]
MNVFWKFSPWMSKAILLPPAAILTMVGVRNLAHPKEQAAERGIAFTNPLGATIYRVGFAGFPLGCAAFLAYCLRSNRRTLTGLIFSALFNGVVLAVRLFGSKVDSTVEQSLPLIKGEIAVVAVSLVGITLEIGRRPHQPRGPLHPRADHGPTSTDR